METTELRVENKTQIAPVGGGRWKAEIDNKVRLPNGTNGRETYLLNHARARALSLSLSLRARTLYFHPISRPIMSLDRVVSSDRRRVARGAARQQVRPERRADRPKGAEQRQPTVAIYKSVGF